MSGCSRRLRAAFLCLLVIVALILGVLAILLWPVTVSAQTPGCAPLERVESAFDANPQFDDVLLLSNAQSVAYFEANFTDVDPTIRVLLVRHVGGTWAALRVFDDEVCVPPLPLQPQVHQRGMAAVYGDPA